MRTRHPAPAFALAAAFVLPALAHAHHAMDNATPATLMQGLVSGLAHPIIGPDHLLFILAMGVACYCFGRSAATAGAFIGATVAGTELHLFGVTLAYADAWVAASLIAGGVLLLTAKGFFKSSAVVAFFALAGLAHGYAYGEAIVGAEQTPLIAYLVGFSIVQLALALCGYATARFIDRKRPALPMLKGVGGALSVAGAAFLALSFTG